MKEESGDCVRLELERQREEKRVTDCEGGGELGGWLREKSNKK